jgi:hypothetical protein
MVAPNRHTSACRLCGLPIGWTVNADGKRKPFDLNPDGSLSRTSHFLTCKVFLQQCAEKTAEKRRKREAEEDKRQMKLF